MFWHGNQGDARFARKIKPTDKGQWGEDAYFGCGAGIIGVIYARLIPATRHKHYALQHSNLPCAHLSHRASFPTSMSK